MLQKHLILIAFCFCATTTIMILDFLPIIIPSQLFTSASICIHWDASIIEASLILDPRHMFYVPKCQKKCPFVISPSHFVVGFF